MAGLFGDIINPDELEVSKPHTPGNHPATISDLEAKTSAGGDPFIVLHFSIEGEKYSIQEWFRVSNKPSDQWDDVNPLLAKDGSPRYFQSGKNKGKPRTEKYELTQSYANLKRRLLSVGVPEDKVNAVGRDDLVGTQVILTTSLNPKGYAQIERVTVPGASGTSLPGKSAAAGSNPFATSSAAAPASAAPATGNPFA